MEITAQYEERRTKCNNHNYPVHSGKELIMPECRVCREEIEGNVVSVEIGSTLYAYHKSCFRCESMSCGKRLSTKRLFLIHDGHVFCKSHQMTFQTCNECKGSLETLDSEPIINIHIDGPFYHLKCVRCKICKDAIPNTSMLHELEGSFYCSYDYEMLRPCCNECGNALEGESIILADGQNFHKACFQCHVCSTPLQRYSRSGNHLVCSQHISVPPEYSERKCFACSHTISEGSTLLKYKGLYLHENCFQCIGCKRSLRYTGRKSLGVVHEEGLKCRQCLKDSRRARHGVSNRIMRRFRRGSYKFLGGEEEEKHQGREKRIRYDLGKQIGEGAFGKVFKCRRVPDNLMIALKELRCVSGSGFFNKEVEILQQLDHENIVKLLGTQWDEKRDCLQIFMEFVPGHSLYDYLHEFGAFPEESLKDSVRQLLRGLSYLHRRNVIHRDLKSKNILISDKGVLKLCDFGSAKRMDTDLQVSVQYDGTPLWTPPETITDGVYTTKSDIWSFGCVLIEMCSANLPWSECSFDNPYAAIYHISRETSVPGIPDSVSPALHSLIKSCLSRDPLARPSALSLLSHPFLTSTDDE